MSRHLCITLIEKLVQIFFCQGFKNHLILTTIKKKSLTTLTKLFTFTTMKMKSLTTLITLFYLITIKRKYLNALTTLFYFATTTKMKSLTKLNHSILLHCY